MGVLDIVLLACTHPNELRALANYWLWTDHRDLSDPKEVPTSGWDRETMRDCWGLLDLTSRSFSTVIKELDGELARVVCLFYLVLRALDTVEDDMTIPNSVKLPLLNEFYTKLDQPGWTFNDSGPNEKDAPVLKQFDKIISEFNRLDEHYQIVIRDVCQKMGRGMASFAALATPEEPVAEVNTIADYDLYCHYVAGLVGEGLSGLFSASGKERSFIKDQLTLSNDMGLLLQKTNITRDFREDVDEGRGFWPRAIWSKYGFAKMGDLRDEKREQEAVWALNEMILDALRHAPSALDYLSLLKTQSVFNFVAIPAVMAIATLERCFNNPDVLKKNVKIRKGEAVQLINLAVNPRDVAYTFLNYAKKMHARISVHDPNYVKFSIAFGKIEQWCEHHYPSFVAITGGKGAAKSSIDLASGDARARLFHRLQEEETQRAARERARAYMQSLREKGLIKSEAQGEDLQKKYLEQAQKEDSIPWMIVLGVAAGMLLTFGILGAAIIWLVLKYSD